MHSQYLLYAYYAFNSTRKRYKSVTVERDWGFPAHEDAIRNYYDAIWIDGDILDGNTAHAYRFPDDIAAKIRYTGYLDQQSWSMYAAANSVEAPLDLEFCLGELALYMADVGQSGAYLAETICLTQQELTAKMRNSLDKNGLDRLPQLVAEIINRAPSD